MAEQQELEALTAVMSSEAIAQLDDLNARVPGGPARDANGGVATIVYLSVAGANLKGNSWTGWANFRAVDETTPFARIDVNGKTYFSSLDTDEGKLRFLRGLTQNQYGRTDLAESMADAETAWNLAPLGAGYLLVLDGPGDKKILSKDGMVASVEATAGIPDYTNVLVCISDQPSPGVPIPPPPADPPPDYITAEVYWWGFHFVVPNTLMDEWTDTGFAVADVIQAASTFAGPAAVFVSAFAGYLEIEFALCNAANQGNGVYVSMSWFAPGIFVPTTR